MLNKLFFCLFLTFFTFPLSCLSKCVGRFINPLTDVCWTCIFPLRIAGIKIVPGNPDPEGVRQPLCVCAPPEVTVPRIGVPVSFWEPVRLVDVTREPYCLVSMGGIQVGGTGIKGRGDVESNPHDGTGHSFYQVHWYTYPLLYWLEVLLDFVCLDSSVIDVAYLTELDPFWNNDQRAFILNPEALLFGNPVAQAACAADCVAATAHLPRSELFWCNGCQGGLYPFTGTINEHMGGVQASLLVVGRFIAKLHRELLLRGTIGRQALCTKYPMPVINKQQYRLQMTYPKPDNQCHALGKSEITWQGGREYPYKGSDFGYLVWRKRDCCGG